MTFQIIEGTTISSSEIKYQQVKVNLRTLLIEDVGENIGTADIILPKDSYIFPGFIDIHIHAREDDTGKHNYKEDFYTVSNAALSGGVVAVMDMPNNFNPPVNNESYQLKRSLMQKQPALMVPFAGIGPNTHPLTINVPYKTYMGPSIGGLYFQTNEELSNKLKEYQGQQISFHCEDPQILRDNRAKKTHQEKRPPKAEIEAIKFAIKLTKKYQLKSIICHLSTKEGFELCIKAKESGLDIKVELSPHHLYFDTSIIDNSDLKLFQVNPPIRDKKNRLYLLEQLIQGNADFLATDHAPHTIEEKKSGISGLTHLDTYGHFVSWLLKEKRMDPKIISKICCENPGKLISSYLPHKLGKIEKGFYGKLTIIHFDQESTIKSSELKTKNRWSPFLEKTFPGYPTIFPKEESK